MFRGHYEHVSQKIVTIFFHHTKEIEKQKSQHPTICGKLKCFYFNMKPILDQGQSKKKSYVQFLTKLMANGVVVKPITMA